jgi:hypothetical protein
LTLFYGTSARHAHMTLGQRAHKGDVSRHVKGPAMAGGPIRVARLLQNPLGGEAPTGERGDFVRISDGDVSLYMTLPEYEGASETTLRWLLAQRSLRGA